MTATNTFRLSVAVPIYNERDSLPTLLSRLSTVLRQIDGGPHEIVIVDDGSGDGSFEFLEEASRNDADLRIVRLARNFGHQVALTAALDHTKGDVVVVMDGDLQDTPETIPRFVAKYREGFDVVYAQRERRKEPFLLRASYFMFYRLLARLSPVTLPLDAGDFGLMSRRVVDELRHTPERHRYLRGLRAWVGFRQVGIPVERAMRAAGDSKYSFGRLLNLAFDGVFSFSTVPLRAATFAGLAALAFCVAFATYAVVVKVLYDRAPQGFTSLILVVTFLSGMQLVFLGVLGEYVGRVYDEVKRRPLYIVDRIIQNNSPVSARIPDSTA